MKYIRTEDGIYEVSKLDYDEFTHQIGIDKGDVFEVIVPIGQSNEIKDLIDCYVYIDKLYGIKPRIYYDFDELFFENEYEESLQIEVDMCDVYGAIWTDKGLIYVAKINEKEDWELL